jgi:hypothetical protein
MLAAMQTFILTWDGSDKGYAPGDYAAHIEATAAGALAQARWSFGSRRGGANADDRVFLLRQQVDRGIVASGHLTDGDVFEGPRWNDPSKMARYVRVTWDRVVAVEDRLPIEELLAGVPGQKWNNIYGSGQVLRPETAAALEARWADHVGPQSAEAGWATPVGAILSRRARGERYGGGLYGGIEPSATTPNVFLYSDPSAGAAFGYNYDGWSEDGTVFLYTGEGQTGSQKMRDGNLAVLQHAKDGRSLRLFVADGSEPNSDAKIQRYVGEFMVDEDLTYVTAESPDSGGNTRSVFVYRLRPVGPVLRRGEDASDSGDVKHEAETESVLVTAVVDAAGSAEPVPVEAVGTSRYEVSGSTSTTAVKWEAELVARYLSHLEKQGHRCVRYRVRPPGELRDLYTDIFDQTENVLYEAKGVATREAVRMALGQLLDYSRHVPGDPSLAVLLPAIPSADLVALLQENKIGCIYETMLGTFANASS